MAAKTPPQVLIIINFGSQYTQLIARRIRELGFYCQVEGPGFNFFESETRPAGIILSGGPSSVYEEGAPSLPAEVWEMGVPILGICYGMQLMAHRLGGKVEPGTNREFGETTIHIDDPICPLFKMLMARAHSHRLVTWMSHGDQVTQLPPGFSRLASSQSCEIAAMGDLERKFYGLQFHPEVCHTQYGSTYLAGFIGNVCGLNPNWDVEDFLSTSVPGLKQMIGDERVVLGLSGGVDSAVTAALLHRAIGDQLTCVYVDTGLMRQGETGEIEMAFKNTLKSHLKVVDASALFLTGLAGVTDPEAKRKIIGALFVDVFKTEASKLDPPAQWLAQGTIYPDVIESAGIKSHHNVGGLPEQLGLKLVEPLRQLFKDEVRALGILVGLPDHLVYRHPFPGPGLAVRVMGEIKPQYLEILRQADHIFLEELRSEDLYQTVSQAFAVFVPVETVGVMGDGRTYQHMIALRAVETTDFMTATSAAIPFGILAKIAKRIVNEVRGVNRVVYDLTDKPPATIEWE